MKVGLNISEAKLKGLYEKQKLTTYQIAEKLGCCQATVWKKLIRFNIKRRTPYELNSNVPSKEELIKLYLKKKLSTWEIEKRYGYFRGTVYRKLKEFDINIRDRADSHILYPRKDFSGDLIEKAYLIGFRLGDLGVRKIYPKSKTICVASGSTIKEQIDLIESLFKPYCRVWIKETKNGKINIQAALNDSFSFLLSKQIPLWVRNTPDTFFAFLAGFSDAEGTISLSKNMAYFSLGNYNKNLLYFIYKNLNKMNIFCNKPTSDKRKGKSNSEGYIYSENYCTLRLSRKDNLLRLLEKLKFFIKHPLKIKALNIAIDNINKRNRLKNAKK